MGPKRKLANLFNTLIHFILVAGNPPNAGHRPISRLANDFGNAYGPELLTAKTNDTEELTREEIYVMVE